MRNSDLFDQKAGRICKYCGVNMDTKDIESLRFFHADCWQQYRKNNEYTLFLQISEIVNRPLTFCISAGMFM